MVVIPSAATITTCARAVSCLYRPLLLLLVVLLPLSVPVTPSWAEPPLDKALRQALQQTAHWPGNEAQRSSLLRLYRAHGYQPQWVGEEGPLVGAEQLLQLLRQAEREGLEPQNYPIGAIEQLWHRRSPQQLARLEILLALSAWEYGRDLAIGSCAPETVNRLWLIPRPGFDGQALLQELAGQLEPAAVLAQQAPPHRQYQRLRELLAYYRQLEAMGGWPSLPAGPQLALDVEDPRVPLLRQRLFAEGDLLFEGDDPSPRFDAPLQDALLRFQQRHGLEASGVVDAATLAALNTSVAQRIEQLQRNMERWRWLPRELPSRRIEVNIPEFKLRAYAGEQLEFSMRVMVGQRARATPMLATPLHTVEFNPEWIPPQSIVLRDLVPLQLRDPDYLSSYGYQVFRNGEEVVPEEVNWRRLRADRMPYTLRQAPGDYNPMGRYKFLLHNRRSITLHDTPERWRFEHVERAYSSGCVRLEKPQRLAEFVLEGSGLTPIEQLLDAMEREEPHAVEVAEPLPVYTLYFTAWAGEDGRAHFRRDIYSLDHNVRLPGQDSLCARLDGG